MLPSQVEFNFCSINTIKTWSFLFFATEFILLKHCSFIVLSFFLLYLSKCVMWYCLLLYPFQQVKLVCLRSHINKSNVIVLFWVITTSSSLCFILRTLLIISFFHSFSFECIGFFFSFFSLLFLRYMSKDNCQWPSSTKNNT